MGEEAPPKLFEHCSTIFEAMKRESSPQKVEGAHTLVYEGFLTRLFAERGMATPYYTTVMRRLKAMGCVRQLSRGGGNSPSKWELLEEPTIEKFEQFEEARFRADTKLGQTMDGVKSLAKRLANVEARLDLLEEKEA